MYNHNTPKFYYEQDKIVFFTTYQGVKIELLRARIDTADFKRIQELRTEAQINMNETMSAIKLAKEWDAA